MHSSSFLLLALAAALTQAKTDLAGCVSSSTVRYGGASILWYVPGTGEICEALDCGGGRAPPKTNVPGCAAYEGTATYSPSFIALATPTTEAAASSSVLETVPSSSAAVTQAPITSAVGGSTTVVSSTVAAMTESFVSGIVVGTTVSSSPSGEITTGTASTLVAVGIGGGSSNSTGTRSSSSSSTRTAPINSVTGNAASLPVVNGLVGVAALGFAFML